MSHTCASHKQHLSIKQYPAQHSSTDLLSLGRHIDPSWPEPTAEGAALFGGIYHHMSEFHCSILAVGAIPWLFPPKLLLWKLNNNSNIDFFFFLPQQRHLRPILANILLSYSLWAVIISIRTAHWKNSLPHKKPHLRLLLWQEGEII